MASSNVIDAVQSQLRQQGAYLSQEYMKEAIAASTGEDVASSVLDRSLYCDYNVCAIGSLPSDIASWNNKVLEGPLILQVDEVTDTAANAKQRYDEGRGGPRCLKLYMTDGKVHVCGFEQEPVQGLAPLMEAGFKVTIQNALVRRGLLLLTTDVLRVLGGKVERLEAARKRAMHRWKQPAACNSGNTGHERERLSLYAEATVAAWPEEEASRAISGPVGEHEEAAHPGSTDIDRLQPAEQAQAGPGAQLSQQDPHGLLHSPVPPQRPPDRPSAQHLQGQSLHTSPEGVLTLSADEVLENAPGRASCISQNSSLQHQLSHDLEEPISVPAGPLADTGDGDAAEADQYWDARDDAMQEHMPVEDDVYELSGDEEADDGVDASATAMQQLASLAQLSGSQSIVYPVNVLMPAAVTGMAKQLSFLDENQNSLSHFSMDVNIEEKAGGDVHTASIHPTVLEKLLGMTTEEMRTCLIGGDVEIAKMRMAQLKHFLRTYVGNMHVRLDRPSSRPVICEFVDADSAAMFA